MSVIVNPQIVVDNDAMTVQVTAESDGHLRVQLGEDQPIANMAKGAAVAGTNRFTYSYASPAYDHTTIFRLQIWGNDVHKTIPNVQVGETAAWDPDEFYETVPERQAHEARKAQQMWGVTDKVG